MKNVVVTGATSMMGVAAIDELIKHEIEHIYAVVRNDCTKLNRLPDDGRIQIIYCDIDSYDRLPELVNDVCDVFYHFAWAGTGHTRNADILGQSKNISYTLMALRSAKLLGCKKFIGAGSQAEYGKLDTEKISPDSPINPIQSYGVTKYAAGKLSIMEAEKLDISCLWVRIFSVYGKYDKPSTMVSSTITKLMNHEETTFTAGDQKWDYLYSADAGKAFYTIGEKSVGRKVYCLGSGKTQELKNYIKTIGSIVDPGAELGIGKIEYTKGTIMNLCADISELQKDTGWEPETSFEDGILMCINQNAHGYKE